MKQDKEKHQNLTQLSLFWQEFTSKSYQQQHRVNQQIQSTSHSFSIVWVKYWLIVL